MITLLGEFAAKLGQMRLLWLLTKVSWLVKYTRFNAQLTFKVISEGETKLTKAEVKMWFTIHREIRHLGLKRIGKNEVEWNEKADIWKAYCLAVSEADRAFCDLFLA